MRRLILAAAVIVLSVGVAEAISNGPGGRFYFARKYNAGPGDNLDLADWRVEVASLVFNADWTVALDGANPDIDVHGNLKDQAHNPASGQPGNTAYGDQLYSKFPSPEIQTSAPNGSSYADLVMGLANSNSNTSKLAGAQTWTSINSMDVLLVEPTVGSLSSTVIGTGRRTSDAGTNTGSTLHTQWGFMAMPDPGAGFTGDAMRVLTTSIACSTGYANRADIARTGSYTGNAGLNVNAAYDAATNPDILDDDDDYLFGTDGGQTVPPITSGQNAEDWELLGDKLFISRGWSSGFFVNYVQSAPGSAAIGARKEWFNKVTVGVNWTFGGEGIATAKMKDGAGALHDTVFATVRVSGNNSIVRLMNLNDDDNAMGAGEYTQIISGLGSDPIDLEYITDGEHHFLVALFGGSTERMHVYELFDNGDYTGQSLQVYSRSAGSASYEQLEVDFGQFPGVEIPEPAVMLLVGTGVLGALGGLRRRRMR